MKSLPGDKLPSLALAFSSPSFLGAVFSMVNAKGAEHAYLFDASSFPSWSQADSEVEMQMLVFASPVGSS